MSLKQITTCLWFDTEGESAAKFYTSIFPNSHITRTTYYTTVAQEFHKHEPGSVLTVSFTINGSPFMALNGGPEPKHNGATSFVVEADNQEELDYYWEKLGEGEKAEIKECGWLADQYGISWQLVPKQLKVWLAEGGEEQVRRVTEAFMKTPKMDVEAMRRAFEGVE